MLFFIQGEPGMCAHNILLRGFIKREEEEEREREETVVLKRNIVDERRRRRRTCRMCTTSVFPAGGRSFPAD